MDPSEDSVDEHCSQPAPLFHQKVPVFSPSNGALMTSLGKNKFAHKKLSVEPYSSIKTAFKPGHKRQQTELPSDA